MVTNFFVYSAEGERPIFVQHFAFGLFLQRRVGYNIISLPHLPLQHLENMLLIPEHNLILLSIKVLSYWKHCEKM